VDTIAEKIRYIRQRKGFSQEDLARCLGVSFPTVNAWERGRSTPYPRHQRAIEDLLQNVMREQPSREVLIVEDDRSSGLVLQDYAEMALPDWEAQVVDNGYDAILQIGLRRPAIVLLDIMMPDIDGFRVFERVREMNALRETRVVFVTAATEDEILDRARTAGAFALIQKPLDRDTVSRVLQEAASAVAG